MSLICEYIIDAGDAEGNNQAICNKVEFKLNTCFGFVVPRPDCDNWNYNLCGSDEEYCQPFVSGDRIYKQFIINTRDTIAQPINIEIIDSDDNSYDISSDVVDGYGQDDEQTTFYNFYYDVDQLPEGVTCFSFKLTFDRTSEEGEDIVFVSEPYCFVDEFCTETIEISGVFDCLDDEGHYYGELQNLTGSNVVHQLNFRVYGNIEEVGDDYTREVVNGKTRRNTRTKRYRLRTPKIPPYVAEMIRRAFAAKELYIDETFYTPPDSVEKNFDEGRMWIIDSVLTRENGELDFTCENPCVKEG